jgi:hypothetical protein
VSFYQHRKNLILRKQHRRVEIVEKRPLFLRQQSLSLFFVAVTFGNRFDVYKLAKAEKVAHSALAIRQNFFVLHITPRMA